MPCPDNRHANIDLLKYLKIVIEVKVKKEIIIKSFSSFKLQSLESALDAYLSDILGLTQQDDKPGKARTIAECLGSAHTAACLLNFARSSRDSSDKVSVLCQNSFLFNLLLFLSYA